MAKSKKVAGPSELAKREPRRMPLMKDGQFVKMVGVGGDVEVTRPGTKPNTTIKEATPLEYKELLNDNTAHLIEGDGADADNTGE